MKMILLLLMLVVLMHAAVIAQSKTYILVHGGWHGAWSWNRVMPLLESKGYRAIAIDLPGHGNDKTPAEEVTLQDYVQKVVSTANKQNGQVILVGHSMAGVVIAQAGEELGKEKVAKLVFLDAFMPKNGESVFSIVGKLEAENKEADISASGPTVVESMVFTEGQKACSLKPENVKALFYHDCLEEDISFAKANLSLQPIAALATPVHLTEERYGTIPKVYILCTEAKDMDKSSLVNNVLCQKIYKLASGHSPFFSMPEELVAILHEI